MNQTITPKMHDYDLGEQQQILSNDLHEWVAYKERLLKTGYGNNVSGLKSWHVLGMGLCSRAVKGACSVAMLVSEGQCFDGWVIVRSLWENTLDVAYFAIQPTHAMRDSLADRYVSYDLISRYQYAKENDLTPKPEWVAEESNWDARFTGSRKKWHGKNTTTDLMSEIGRAIKIETPDRMGPIVDMSRTVARFAKLHWKTTSDYTHGSPRVLSRLWRGTVNPSGWTDAADDIEPGWCLYQARYAMICACNLYAVSSPVLAGVAPPRFDFD
jgi:hypothetical protein